METQTTIDRVVNRMDQDHEKVQPGQTVRMHGYSPGDVAWQGDLGLKMIEQVPAGYTRVEKPKAIDCQLVPGNTQGAKHCLDSLTGVELYRPIGWGEGENLLGPVFRTSQERTVQHPTHGAVVVPADTIIQCGYQREFDSETMRERRNAD